MTTMTTGTHAGELKGVSSLIVERLATDPAYRRKFQADPVAALRESGVPEKMLPSPEAVQNLDFIALGRRVEQIQIKGAEAIAVACVVI